MTPPGISVGYVLAALAVMWAVTYALRLAPFLAVAKLRDNAVIAYLGRTMPLGVMIILVIYSLAAVDLGAPPHGLPEALALAITVGLHVWRRNVLLSLVGGTASYILLLTLF